MKKLFIYLVVFTIFFPCTTNCSGGGGDDPNPGPDPVIVDPPGVATLIFPNENSECTEGTNATSSESDVIFDWNDAANAESYQLYLKNLDTQTTTNYTSSTSQLSVTLLRSTPYSWYVISKNSGTKTAQSATWKFYNAGEAVSSYAPFPAELESPEMGTGLSASTTSVTLQWKGSDVDNDIVNYDVVFGTANPPTNNQGTTTATNMSVNVTSGTTYYWRILTTDGQNNTSESEVFQFKIN
ncbi:hypothetical protein [Yeosuana marina]|uniref:hypothetical protein n=1 Tax=Yeosuana marina TaxID=1565536 RepID=UPI0030ED7177|tara:strand:- start:1130 stop:1849 length:720 start_codon:yes stop_codon:yes gene_type:complete